MAHNQCVYCGGVIANDNVNRDDFCSLDCMVQAMQDDFENCGSYVDFATEAGSL